MVKEGVRICGKKMEVDWYVEVKPDTQCKVCSGWGHIEEKCASPPRCNICASGHRTDQHQCNVTGCTTKRGNVCAHTNAKCPNCRGAHIGTARECLKKREAIAQAKEWRRASREANPGDSSESREERVREPEAIESPDSQDDDEDVQITGTDETNYAPGTLQTEGEKGGDEMMEDAQASGAAIEEL